MVCVTAVLKICIELFYAEVRKEMCLLPSLPSLTVYVTTLMLFIHGHIDIHERDIKMSPNSQIWHVSYC